MPNTQIVGAAKSYGLDKLNTWISERERLLGPLIEIADGGAQTSARFDLDKDRVRSSFSRVSLKVGSQCVALGGATLVGEGEAYIAGVLMPVCVWR